MSKFNHGVVQYPEKKDIKINNDLWHAIGVQKTRFGMEIDTSSLPFAPDDVTAGSESEMQTLVKGERCSVDLPMFIEQSNYWNNIRRRAKAGDASEKIMTDLEKYLTSNDDGIWENSWVRFPLNKLGKLARQILEFDTLADKKDPSKGKRSDGHLFFFQQNSEAFVRIPVSYLLKLSFAQAMEPLRFSNHLIFETGLKIMDKFLNDNTSPETSSLYIVSAKSGQTIGDNAAKEMAVRYLLGQILLMYANRNFSLQDNGQNVSMFFSPHPPVRQKRLSHCISDSFYREIFMNPCLSGWDEGKKKYEYMHLCHRVLSRSQFNAVLKLRDAGIITNNLVSLPNLSNISLANNGTHVSMGSRRLSVLLGDSSSGYTRCHEKYLGDLVVKIAEHFLPLFIGTYTAAPYRMGFNDFHPEKALGFLPHELDYTHLRMLWRRWQKKADLKILGYPITPFGPHVIDRLMSALCGLKGDYIYDYRLIDYLVCILSTEQSPALNGELYNSHALKKDLADLGVFDTSMSLYMFDKLRDYDSMGFSGFEGRHFSLFHGFMSDMARAINLQNLIYLLAFKYIVTQQIDHRAIPDDPFIESERRQIIFGSAIGIPTFFVHRDTRNVFLKHILEKTQRTRSSRRYGGYLRVHNIEYRRALLDTLRMDASDLIDMLDFKESMSDLEQRLKQPDLYSASGKITGAILHHANARSPMSINADTFNTAAENYYRTDLRKHHIQEAFDLFDSDISTMDKAYRFLSFEIRKLLNLAREDSSLNVFLTQVRRDILQENVTTESLERLIYLIVAYVHYQHNHFPKVENFYQEGIRYAEAPVH